MSVQSLLEQDLERVSSSWTAIAWDEALWRSAMLCHGFDVPILLPDEWLWAEHYSESRNAHTSASKALKGGHIQCYSATMDRLTLELELLVNDPPPHFDPDEDLDVVFRKDEQHGSALISAGLVAALTIRIATPDGG